MNLAIMFLDRGRVLPTNGWDRRLHQLAVETSSLDGDELKERRHLTFDAYEEGKLSLDEYLAGVVFYEDRPFTREAFQDFMFTRSRQTPEMAQTEGFVEVGRSLGLPGSITAVAKPPGLPWPTPACRWGVKDQGREYRG